MHIRSICTENDSVSPNRIYKCIWTSNAHMNVMNIQKNNNQNATKHGILSKHLILHSENATDLEMMRDNFSEDLKPIGTMEEILVDQIVSGYWRLKRLYRVETQSMDWYANDNGGFTIISESEEQQERKSVRDMLNNQTIEVILRYQATIERSIYRAYHELERLQARRNNQNVPLPIQIDTLFDGKL